MNPLEFLTWVAVVCLALVMVILLTAVGLTVWSIFRPRKSADEI